MKPEWQWKLNEAVERVRTRYMHIGRKTGAPFLALLYPPAEEPKVLREWHSLIASLAPDFDAITIDVLEVTAETLDSLGVDNVVDALQQPMPGSDPVAELGHIWVEAITKRVRESLTNRTKPAFVSLERLAALHPVAGPRDVMQQLWDSVQSDLEGPVIVLIPGTTRGPRTYTFLDQRNEFLYRGDLL